MAQRVFGAASATPEERYAGALARWLSKSGLRTFNARALRLGQGGPGGSLRKSKAMEIACERLVDAGIIRPAGTRDGDTVGRKSSDYEVNPLLFGSVS